MFPVKAEGESVNMHRSWTLTQISPNGLKSLCEFRFAGESNFRTANPSIDAIFNDRTGTCAETT
jgi:hypothetical protein